MIFPPGSTSVSVDVFFADDPGAALTSKVASDFPVVKWSGGSNTADTTITLSDLAAITTAHPNDNTAGGVKEREGGWYRLDLPNNMFTSAGRKTLTFAETTNKRIIAPTFDVQKVAATLGASDYSGNTVQTGDAYARVGAPAGASLAADVASIKTDAGTLLSRLSATRAGYLDNLTNLDAAISALNNLSALINIYGSPLLEIPDSSSTLFAFTVVVRDNEGKLVDLDGSPTLTAASAGGTSRTANLSSVSHPATGRYTFTYSVASDAAEESLRITVAGAVSSEARYIEWIGAVVNYDTLTVLNAINTKIGTPAGASIAADIAAVQSDTDNIQTRLPAALSGGYMKTDVIAYAGTPQSNGDLPIKLDNIYNRLGAPAGASISEDIAAVPTLTEATADKDEILGALGVLTGSNSVTLTFEDAAHTAVPYAIFTVVGKGSGQANGSGVAAFSLDNGTYSVRTRATGSTLFANAALVVSGTKTQTITGMATNVTPAADPAQTIAFIVTLDGAGTPVEGETCFFQLVDPSPAEDDDGAGKSWSRANVAATSGDDGLLEVALARGVTYKARRGQGGEWTEEFTTDDASTYELPEILGKPQG